MAADARRTGSALFHRTANPGRSGTVAVGDEALLLIQEGLRSVVRLPGGTAHALDSGRFPIAVMGKTGTTNDYRDAWIVGYTPGIVVGAGGQTRNTSSAVSSGTLPTSKSSLLM